MTQQQFDQLYAEITRVGKQVDFLIAALNTIGEKKIKDDKAARRLGDAMLKNAMDNT